MKSTEFKKLLNSMIKEEFKKEVQSYLKAYVPIVVAEVVKDLVDNRINEVVELMKPKKTLKESVAEELEDWPTLTNSVLSTSNSSVFNRKKLESTLGYGTQDDPALNIVSTVVSDSGRQIPVSGDKIPESFIEALNRDYRPFLKKMKKE